MPRAMRKKNSQTGKNYSHSSSSLTEKFQARQQVFYHLNYYARDILRGPLAILKREWEEPSESDHSVLLYILKGKRNAG